MLTLDLGNVITASGRTRFEEIYHAYRKQMFLVARSVVRSDADAEDVVHDVFERLARRHMETISAIANENDLRNYLLKATKNTALNHRKKFGRLITLDTVSEYDLSGIPDYSDEAFLEYIYNKVTYERIVQAIRDMDTTYRDVLYFHFVMELTIPEVARTLGRRESTVKKQLVRGKKLLLTTLNVNRKEQRSNG